MKLETIGKIINGEMANWFVIIKDDRENTGGYLVVQSPSREFNSEIGYDTWFPNLDEVKQFLKGCNLIIEWSE